MENKNFILDDLDKYICHLYQKNSIKYCIIHNPINYIFKNCVSYSRKPIIKKSCKCHIRKYFIDYNNNLDYIDCHNDSTLKINITITDLYTNIPHNIKMIVCNECFYKLTTFALNYKYEFNVNIEYHEVNIKYQNVNSIYDRYGNLISITDLININNNFCIPLITGINNKSPLIIKYDRLRVMLNIIFNIKLKKLDSITINWIINNICSFIN